MALTVRSEVDWLWLSAQKLIGFVCTLTLSQPLCHRTGIGPVRIGREGAVGEPQPTCKSDHQTLFQTLRSWCHRPAFCLWCLLTPVHAGSSQDQLRISLDHATLKKPGGIPRRRPRKTTALVCSPRSLTLGILIPSPAQCITPSFLGLEVPDGPASDLAHHNETFPYSTFSGGFSDSTPHPTHPQLRKWNS